LGLSLYRAGGAGGGAIILDIQGELLNNGVISANGENGASHNFGGPASTGAGSGGSINIATGILSGSGIIRANGGHSSSGSGAGGGGRVAFYYDTNSFSGNIEVFGGKDEDGSHHGGAGTIFISQGSGLGDLIVNNNNQSGKTLLVEEVYSFNDVVIENGVNFYLPNQLVSVNLIVKNSALTAPDNTGMNISDTFNLNNSRIIGQNQGTLTIEGNNIILTGGEIEANVLVQSNSLLIDSGSTVSSTGLGYLAEEGLGAGIIGYGGSYGGLGGRNYPSSGFGQPYGNKQMPDYFGSGGGNGSAVRKGGSGGGKIEIISAGEIAIDGAISSNGNNGVPHITSYPSSGAGSGGAVYISANIISGAGIISANGGLASSASGGGGGGRVAIYGNMDNFIGIVEALGGINFENALHDGKDGTVFLSP